MTPTTERLMNMDHAQLVGVAEGLLEALSDLTSAEGLPKGYADRKALIAAARAAIAAAKSD